MNKNAGLTKDGLNCGCMFEKPNKEHSYPKWAVSCAEHATAFVKVIQNDNR